MRIAITGPTGAIGSEMVRLALAEGNEVIAIVRPDSKRSCNLPEHAKLTVVECDISDTTKSVAASLKYDCGVIGTLHMNSDCLYTETTGITVFGTEGILYMPDPNRFGGEVKLQKLQSEPIVFPLTHGYQKNSRGIGAAEMAWSMLKGRLHRANMYLAQSVFETAHAIETASAEKRVVTLESTFERPAALPEGYIDNGFWGPMPEASLAL